ncbi:MAG: MerR family transcriptional regulator [Desulfovibrio sp.]|nr:MerR family transcriptional regulator [Desulfovibrio sp.]
MSTYDNIPLQTAVITRQEFIEVTGISAERLQDLLSLGWLEQCPGTDTRFREGDIYRVRKVERICCDFDLPVLGGVIIVDLLERIDTLERTLRSLKEDEA